MKNLKLWSYRVAYAYTDHRQTRPNLHNSQS